MVYDSNTDLGIDESLFFLQKKFPKIFNCQRSFMMKNGVNFYGYINKISSHPPEELALAQDDCVWKNKN